MPKSEDGVIHHDVMYETRDVDASVIGWIAVAVIASAFLIYFTINVSQAYFARTEFRSVQPVTQIKAQASAPSAPLLQIAPAADLEKLRQTNEQILNSYGWVDRDKGIVRIPIDEAMKKVLERGLPSAQKAKPNPVNEDRPRMKEQ